MIRFFVPGLPAPGGSKKQMLSHTTGRVITLEDCDRTKGWRERVASVAMQEMVGRKPFRGALHVRMVFHMPRPRGHLGTGRNQGRPKPSAPNYPTTKPDTTKLLRSTEDALKGIVWIDDCQVVEQHVIKVYGSPGVAIQVQEMES